MKVTTLDQAERRPRKVAVGEFDGVHLGHREVIKGNDTVLTFDPHPLQVVRPEAAPKLLTSTATKAELVEEIGVSEMVVIPFDRSFSEQTAQEFVDHVLIEQVGATHVSVGENFRFGNKAGGDTELLRAQAGFETRVVPLVEVEGEIISSSHIRGLVLAGEVDHAAVFLGAPFRMTGPVIDGDKRGRDLGFPTANLVPDESLIYPGHGVYACRAGEHAAAVNVGVRPTFGTGRAVLVEAYLLDFEGDLYGTELTLEFRARLRGEKRFDSAEALIDQMRRDVETTRELVG